MPKPKINVPNWLTIARMVMVLPFIAFLTAVGAMAQYDPLIASPAHYHLGDSRTILFVLAGVIFTVAMATDWLDGYLARKNRQVTTFGKLFDPLADKIMTTSALIFLSALGIVPIYLTIIIVVRDLVVDGARNVLAANHHELGASHLAKAKTMVISLGIIALFFLVPIFDEAVTDIVNPSWALYLLNIPIFIGVILSLVSGFFYVKPLGKYLRLR